MSAHNKLKQIEAIVIGASAGGIDVLLKILPEFKRPSALTVAVVVHIMPNTSGLLPSIFEPLTNFTVKEAESGEPILQETIFMAAPDYHLSIEPNFTLALSHEEKVKFSRPSIDVLFESAAYAYRDRLLAILLSGANDDGADGMQLIQQFGGFCVVQNPAEAAHAVMPQAAIDTFTPDMVLTSDEIKLFLCKLVKLRSGIDE
jgi:two-component system, chemotaxis family, protein-glutamate methylesterase/glutaminase